MHEHDDIQFHSEPDVSSHARLMETRSAREHLAMQMLKQIRESLNHVINLLELGDMREAHTHILELVSSKKALEHGTGMRVIEGMFDGECMVGSDGVRYEVPVNYSSKSRLVEGDLLKLLIGADGGYTYKQIRPVDRQRVIGKLLFDSSTNEPVALCDEKRYKVLSASVSYFKGMPGDEIVLIVPRDGVSSWAAVENIVSS
jgi:hypothetical protein